MDYQYGNKAQWRRWVWNRVGQLVDDSPESTILFLAGEQALDIDFAARKGFLKSQFIAVENDGEVAGKLRARKIPTLHMSLLDVIYSWPSHKPVEVVHADFCGGLTKTNAATVVWAMANPAFHDAVFVVNMLRGRDPSMNKFREVFNEKLNLPKDRAMQLMAVIGFHTIINYGEEFGSVFLSECRFHKSSYRSTAGNQYFDTLVFRSPFGRILGSTD